MKTIRVRPRKPPENAATIKVAEEEALLNSREFAHFLYLFRAAYLRCLQLPQLPQLPSNAASLRDTFSSSFYGRVSPLQIANLFNSDAEDDELKIARISKESPLEITFICVVTALTAAVILSGGKVDLKIMKFTLPPVGVGIKHLREAFRLPPSKTKKLKK